MLHLMLIIPVRLTELKFIAGHATKGLTGKDSVHLQEG